MTDRVEIGAWDVPVDVLPRVITADTIYLVPGYRDSDGRPAYRPESMLLQKGALSQGVHLDYALAEDDRQFVDFFSVDPEEIQLWLAAAEPITDVFLFSLAFILERILRRRGSGKDAMDATPLDLRIAKLNLKTGKVRGVRLRGNAADVVDAVRDLTKRP